MSETNGHYKGPDERGPYTANHLGEFARVLRAFRERANRSRNNLAHEVGVDPSYLTRIEHGDREPPRQHIVEAICKALRLTVADRNRLLVSAGYAPVSVMQLGQWDDALQAVADVLNDHRLSPEDRQQFKDVVQMIAARWRSGRPLTSPVAH